MKTFVPGFLLMTTLVITAFSIKPSATTSEKKIYVCTPCGYDCDKAEHSGPGMCSHCNMPLVEKKSIRFSSISPAEVCNRLAQPDVIVLDVRTPEEFKGTAPDKFGSLKNAINIPVQQLAQRIGELKAWQQKTIIVYCSHSHRSPAAAYLLGTKGFKKVMNMQYGMHQWKQQGGCAEWLVPQ